MAVSMDRQFKDLERIGCVAKNKQVPYIYVTSQ